MKRNAALIAVLFVLGAVGFTQGQLQEANRAPAASRRVSLRGIPRK